MTKGRAALAVGAFSFLLCDTARAEPARISGVHIVSRVGARGMADERPKRALRDQGVTLYAVVVVGQGWKKHVYSDAGREVVIGGRRRAARPIAEAPTATFAWFKVEPTTENLSNTASGSFRYEVIEYAETPMAVGVSAIEADVHPTLTTDRGKGVGTMRYRLTAITADGTFATPGVDARRGKGSGGLRDSVHRVSLRRDDTYLGYLDEMFGQPYIWASAGARADSHQSERLEGADCADFVVYGRRRMGEKRAYTWTGALPAETRKLAAGRADARGIYVDASGAPLPYSGDGDLVLFPRHVGVLTGDRGEKGVLDHADLMVHAYFATPRVQSLGETDYRDAPVEVRRWR